MYLQAERALILVQSRLLIDSDPSSSVGKNHKILQTLNEATNKMSHTGTAFSSGNWETDTLAYMDSIKDLPHSRIQDILTRAEEYMKHPRHNRRSTAEDSSGSSHSIAPATNKCARLRICNFSFYFIFTCWHLLNRTHPFNIYLQVGAGSDNSLHIPFFFGSFPQLDITFYYGHNIYPPSLNSHISLFPLMFGRLRHINSILFVFLTCLKCHLALL